MREPLTRRDWALIAICALVFAASLFVILNWFSAAFPEAAIDFRYDRDSSVPIAEKLLRSQGIATAGSKHTVVFNDDDSAKIFLERTLGLERANVVMRRDVHIWAWQHRWFRPLQEEEYALSVAPTGEIVAFLHHVPEARAIATPSLVDARGVAERFLAQAGAQLADLQLVSMSERKLPNRMQRIFTWESKSIHPGGAPYRYDVTVDGNVVTSFAQHLRVPEDWQRTYRELRSKNNAAGNVDLVFLAITVIAALTVFVTRLRRGDLRLKFLLGVAVVSVILSLAVSLNSFPSTLSSYDTTTSYPAFLAQTILFGTLLPAIGTALFLVVIVGSGEVLYRERLPKHLAVPRIWTPRALASKRVFRSFILGYTLVAFFIAYQVAFYLIAGRFGAWSPAEIPYDDILNSAFPWVAVLFAGFFPALSEEFMSRAFSIPFFERLLRSRIGAIVLAGFIWGFGHATYPNQPFYIRGVEVGCAGVLLGFLLYRFGLLPLLIWHYTVDALYTALLLFRSHNRYYVLSAAFASLIFLIPMLVSIVLYVKNRGFLSDDDLTNAADPVPPPAAATEHVERAAPFPPPVPVERRRLLLCVVAIAIAAIALTIPQSAPEDSIDYRTTRIQAKEIATRHVTSVVHQHPLERVIATPLDGFRSWDASSEREEGGSPGGFDSVAADYLLQHGVTMRGLVDIFRTRVEAATWTVRFFAPMVKTELFVEVDPRNGRVIGYHKYQSEKSPGPRLEQPAALALARGAFNTYGLDAAAFEVKESLSFQQPNRRDWLFHFQELKSLAADAQHRVSIRVAGDEVTQFTNTVKVPDAVYRDAAKQTLLNVALTIVRIAGTIAVLSLVIAGFVISTRKGRFPWRRALRWTAVLAIIPIAGALAGYEDHLFAYSTSVQWNTFLFDLVVDTVRTAGLQILLLFMAIVGIDSALPYGLNLLRREGRARFGRAAAVAAITAVALFAAFRALLHLAMSYFPSAVSVHAIDVPAGVALPWPAVLAIAEAAYRAVTYSAAAALFAVALLSLSRRKWLVPFITIASVFSMAIDAGVTPQQAPLMLLRAALLGVVVWLIVRFVLDGNALAWPVAFFIAAAAGGAMDLLQNHRSDLVINGMAMLGAIGLVLLWLSMRSAPPAIDSNEVVG